MKGYIKKNLMPPSAPLSLLVHPYVSAAVYLSTSPNSLLRDDLSWTVKYYFQKKENLEYVPER